MQREIDRLRAAVTNNDAQLIEQRRRSEDEVRTLRQENAHLQEAVGNLTSNVHELEKQHAETTFLLEDALQQKDDEARNLAASLSMLESRLQHSVLESHQAVELKSMLDQCAVERDELLILVAEMDEEKEIRRAAHDASVISPPRTATTDVEMTPFRGRDVLSEAE
ncbi:Hypothetical protein, putative [Bodo saltans]|uniref:Uncharacterized protein n=1 Tax=Bodo saltans TaxID=75058 RepID=A0A0S4KKN6_BODSA|nr:Hypothetical protein, putative [Bodo saltans]|eukprot:CUI15155.1 Hypothetical protein, putative [Bodo saltans]